MAAKKTIEAVKAERKAATPEKVSTKTKTSVSKNPYKGSYTVIPVNGLNIRKEPDGEIITAIPQGHLVTCAGQRKNTTDAVWLAVKTVYLETEITGYCRGEFLSKV